MKSSSRVPVLRSSTIDPINLISRFLDRFARCCSISYWARSAPSSRLASKPAIRIYSAQYFSITALALALALAACGGSAKRAKPPAPPAPLSAQAYAHYLRGKVALFEEDFPKALRQLRQARLAAPEEQMVAVAMIDVLNRSGRGQDAKAEIAQAIRHWPNSSPLWILRGTIYEGLGDHAEAAASYQQAIGIGGPVEEVLLAHAQALQALGKTSAAEKAYKKVLASNEDNALAHLELAELLELRGKHKDSAEHLTRASRLAPHNLQAWGRLFLSLRGQGHAKRARQALQRPFDGNRDPMAVANALFEVLLDRSTVAIAAELVPILDRSDLSQETRIAMAYLYVRIGFFAHALTLAEALDEPIATDPAVAELRAGALRSLHRNEEAKTQLMAITQGSPGFARSRRLTAAILVEQQRFDDANALLRSAMQDYPDDPELTLSLAATREAAGNVEDGEKILEQALAAHPESARTIYALAELHARNGRPAAAVALVQTLLDSAPWDPAALNYVGFTLLEAGIEPKRARNALKKAIKLAPDNAYVLDSYGWMLLSAGQLGKAKPYLERAARLAPAQVEILGHLAELRSREGKRPEALRLLKRAKELAITSFERDQIQKQLQALIL